MMTIFEQQNLQTLAASGEVLEKIVPDIFRHYYPRRYAAPGSHYSPRLMSSSYAGLAASAEELQLDGRLSKDWTLNCTIVIGARLAFLGMPTYWVTQEFVEMVMEAAPPPDMKVSEIVWPIEGLSILLPIDSLRDPSGSPVMWISFCHAFTGMDTALLPNRTSYVENKLNGLTMCAYTASGCYYGQTLPADALLASHDPGGVHYGETLKDAGSAGIDQERLAVTPKQDEEFNVHLAGIAANILMYMMAAQEGNFTAREEGVVARKAKPQKGVDALWNPSWIGREYQHPAGCRNLGGSHASPRVHWRRAHYRRQYYGAGRSQVRTILIPRKLVNASTAAQTVGP
jgi:hypothetical protein